MTRDSIRARVEAIAYDGGVGTDNEADAAFIAAARQDIPALLAVADAAAAWIGITAVYHPFCKPDECEAAALRDALTALDSLP